MQTTATRLGFKALLESLPGVTRVTFDTTAEMIYRDHGYHVDDDIHTMPVTTIRAYFETQESFQRARKMTLVLKKIDALLRIRGNAYRVISIVPKVASVRKHGRERIPAAA